MKSQESQRIYLDYNATTPVHPEVTDAMLEALQCCGNPSSIHQEGQKARVLLESSRRDVADLLQVSPQEIYFTSGGTEANNLALFSYLRSATHDSPLEVITTAVEHPSISKPLKFLEQEKRIKLRYLPIRADATLSLEALPDLLTEKTALLTLMLVNNELGSIFPVLEVAKRCRQIRPSIKIHCDAIQAVGRIPVLPMQLGVDSLSFSAHKFYGPKGVGALWSAKEDHLCARQMGGGQEAGLRSGTENMLGIVGMGKAARIAKQEHTKWQQEMEPLRDLLEARLLKELDSVRVNAQESPRIYSTSNLHFSGCPGDVLQQALDLQGIAVSTGSACSSGTVSSSPVLLALGQTPHMASQAIRISLGWGITRSAIERVVEAISLSVKRIRESL